MTDRAWLTLDRVCRRLKRYLGDADTWKEEVCGWAGIDPKDWDAVWAKEQLFADLRWNMLREAGATDWTPYYACRYFALRGAWYRRHDTFYMILRTMGPEGTLLDFGCGVGTVGLWLAKRRPNWTTIFIDLPSPAQEFLRWRRNRRNVDAIVSVPPVLVQGVIPHIDVLLCLDVFEHLPKPHETLAALLECLKPGGHLFCSMSPDTEHENIGGKHLPEVLAVLDATCEERLGMTDTDHYGHYVKR